MRYHEIIENEILDEMPMPAEWDKAVYQPHVSYAKRINYAAERAAKLGKGSSRSAFLITVDGKESVLKVAHNLKGLAQNEVEADILRDSYAKSMDILIPMIDYDEEHDQPLWINTERATKVSAIALCKIMKCERLTQVVGCAQNMIGQRGGSAWDYIKEKTNQQIIDKFGEDGLETFHEYAQKLADLGSAFDIQLADFGSAANWGLYDGDPVVLDIGFNSSVQSSHYSPKRANGKW